MICEWMSNGGCKLAEMIIGQPVRCPSGACDTCLKDGNKRTAEQPGPVVASLVIGATRDAELRAAMAPHLTRVKATTPVQPEVDHGADCVYRSKEIRIELCQLCGSIDKPVPVFNCSKHGCECSASRWQKAGTKDKMRTCAACVSNGENMIEQQADPVVINKLAVIACYFNPAGWASLRRNYLRFVSEFSRLGVPLYVAEVAFTDEPFLSDAFVKIRASSKNIIWQKERLLNLIVERLPSDVDAVAWIDADVTFFDPEWSTKTVAALAQFPVVQLWGKWHFTDGEGRIEKSGISVGHLGSNYRKGNGYPGGAWAARREVFPLYESHVIGGGDSMAVEAWLGMRETFPQKQMNETWRDHFQRWANDAHRKVGGLVTSLDGEALHWYHGSRSDRHYSERSKWLAQYQYDPSRHVRIGDNGLLEWTDDAPSGLVEKVREYFHELRKEDS